MPDYQIKRCFVALPLDEIAVADLSDFMDALNIEGLRLTRPENLHITLKFLGNVEDPSLPEIMQLLRDAAAGVDPFELNVKSAAYLPDARRARVLAAICDQPPPPEMLSLFQRVEDALETVGFQREGRAYHPHITLGRFRRPPRHPPSADSLLLTPTMVPVQQMVLMQSDLGRGAPAYLPLAKLPLGR